MAAEKTRNVKPHHYDDVLIIYFYLIYIFDENNTQNLDDLNTLTFNILIHRSFIPVSRTKITLYYL